MITSKYTPSKAKKKAVRKNKSAVKAKVKIKPKPEEPFTKKGLKELKLAFEGKLELRDAKHLIEEIKNGK